MGRLRVVQLTREFGLIGGSESVAFELHRAWRAKGIDVRSLVGHVTEAEVVPGVLYTMPWLHRWGLRSPLRRLAVLSVIPLYTLRASWLARRDHADAIIVSHGDALTGDVCVMHAVNIANLAEKKRAGEQAWMLNPIHLWVSLRDRVMLGGRRYRRVVAISERVQQDLKTYYGLPDERIAIIPNGINLDRFRPGSDGSRAEVRREFGLPADVPLLLFVGNEFQRKGLAHVIQAMALMNTNANLLVVGADADAPYRRLAAQCGVAERVVFVGSRPDVPRLYPAADAFVLPTMYETFSLVCVEAMACGVPVLASPVGGIEDYIHDGVNGLHIERDAADIAPKLDRLLRDAALRARLREAGLETAKRYSWEAIAEQYLRLFAELLRERESEAVRGNARSGGG